MSPSHQPLGRRCGAFLSILISILVGVTMPTSGRAADVVNNLGNARSGDFALFFGEAAAQPFTTDGNAYTLTALSVMLNIEFADSEVNVELRSDSGGAPGTVLETWPGNVINAPTPTALMVSSAGGVTLAANTTYWVVVHVGTGDTVFWSSTATQAEPGPGTVALGKWGTHPTFSDNLTEYQWLRVQGDLAAPPNSAPTDITLSAASLAENNAANATVGALAAVDPDNGQTHTFTLVAGTGDTDNAAFNIAGANLRLTGVADFETKSSYSVRVKATDDGAGNLTFEKEFTINITDVNEAPVLAAIGDKSVDASSELTFTATATDVDSPANLLTFAAVGLPAGATINPTTGVFRWTPTEAQGPGIYQITVTVTDNGTGSLSDSEIITVTVNGAPTLEPIGVPGLEDTTLTFTAANFTGAYTDPESTALASIKIESLPATGTLKLSGADVTQNQVIPAANLGNLTYVPALNDNGAKTFTVSASDGALSSGAATVTVSLTAVNDAPSFSLSAVDVETTPSATIMGVNLPTALAFDGSDNLYVADYSLNTVSRFAPGATTPSATLTGLESPIRLAFDSSGNLFVANESSSVSKFAAASLAGGATTPSAALIVVGSPIKLAVDGSGNLFVVNSGNGTVSRFAPEETTPSATLTGTTGPSALAVDGSGNLFVANFSGNTVSKFAMGATTPTATLTGLNGPEALAFDSSGNLFVANFSGNTVSKFAMGATTPSATLTGLNGPSALAVDGSGNLYVINSGTVSKFAPGATMPSATLMGLNSPSALAVDGSGNLYVANLGGNSVSRFARSPNQTAAADAGTQTVPNFAKDFSPGPADESAQTLVGYTVTVEAGKSGLFSTPPAIANNGTLTYTPAVGPGGSALITVVAQDNGGTANGGVDTSAPQTFTIAITPAPRNMAIAATDASKDEGNSGTTAFTFTVTRSGDTTGAGSAAWAVTGSGGNPADAADFSGPLPSGMVSFNAGETSKDITINVSGDTDVEADEDFTVTLSNPSGATLTTTTAVGLIQNDDVNTPPTLTAIGVPGLEDTTLTFTAANFTGAYTDPESTALASIKIETLPASGTLKLSGADVTQDQVILAANLGNLTYVPALNENGAKTFTVSASDGTLSSPVATVTMTLTAVNDAPTFALPGSEPNLRAWGSNGDGQLGDGTTTARLVPTTIGMDSDWQSVATASTFGAHTLAVKSDGTLWGWGFNSVGQLGDGTTMARPGPVRIGMDSDWQSVATAASAYGGEAHTVALKRNGTLWAWGFNGSGQLGLGAGAPASILLPTQIGDATDWQFVATATGGGKGHTVAVKSNGTLWAWGDNSAGQLGLGGAGAQTSPVQIGTDSDWQSVAVAAYLEEFGSGVKEAYHTVAVKADGTLWGWGDNNSGQLGLGNGGPARATSPTRIGPDANWQSVTTASGTLNGDTLAVKNDGTLWGWGANRAGQLGNGTKVGTASPVRIGTADDWQTVATVSGSLAGHTVAVKVNGTLWAWGSNNNGQLGTGNTTEQTTPTRIGMGTNWQSVALASGFAGSHTLALTTLGFNSTVPVDAGTQTVPDFATNFSPGPADESAQTLVGYAVTVEAGKSGLFSTPPAIANNGTLTYTPAVGPGGSALITVVAQDNGGTANGGVDTSAPRTFSITLTPAPKNMAITATDASKVEGNSGTTAFTFTVTRSGDTTGAGSADWAVTGSGGNPVDAADFGGTLPSGMVSFNAGETSKVITLNVSGDTDIEPNEGFTVTLSNPSGATLTTATAVGLIRADETGLAIAATDATKAEGNTGNTPFTFTVTRIGDPNVTTTVDYAVTGVGNIFNAADADDFGGAFPSGMVSFAAGETSKVITLNVSGDTVFEFDNDFTVTLSNPGGGVSVTAAAAAGKIVNDDIGYSIAANVASRAEGNSGTTAFTFTITRGIPASGAPATSVDWAVTGSGANPANADDFDGSPLPSGMVNFPVGTAGQVLESVDITVPVSGDIVEEADEGFTVTLSNPSANTHIVAAQMAAAGVIQNDDNPPTLTAIGVPGLEDTTLTFTAANFTDAYTDPESTALASIKIETLPATGTLKLSGADVTLNQVIPAANLGNLTYVPALNENGDKTFTVSASNGALSSPVATVTMTLASVNDAPSFALHEAAGLDTSFTNPNLNDRAYSVAVDANGKILVAGFFITAGSGNSHYFRLARFNADGTLDTSFTNPNLNDRAYSVAVDANGKILVAGNFTTAGSLNSPYGRLARFNADGTLDTSFTNPNLNNVPFSVAVDANGKILVAGFFTTAGSLNSPYGRLARFNADGTLDTSFTNPNLNGGAFSVAVDANGKILVAGDFTTAGSGNSPYGRLARFNADGTLDTSFTNPNLTGGARSVAVDANGKILVGGSPFTTAGSGNSPYGGLARFHTGNLIITAAADAVPQTVANFATNFSPGPADESAQTLVGYTVTVEAGKAGLFSTPPAIANNGTLTYTPAVGPGGSALITVVAQDNGLTANGGVDTSAPQTFSITITAGATIVVNNATELAAAIDAAGASGTTIVLNSNLDLSGLAPITKNVTFTAGNGVTLTGALRVGTGGTVNLGGGNLPGASITVQSGGTLTGNGSFTGTLLVQSGGTVSPGASPGTFTFDNGTLDHGVTYEWEINDASGAPGTADLLVCNNVLTFASTPQNPLLVRINTLTPQNQPGPMAGFDPNSSYAWTIAQAGSVVGFDANAFALDTTGVVNARAGGAFGIRQSGGNVQVTFTPGALNFMLLTNGVAVAEDAGAYSRHSFAPLTVSGFSNATHTVTAAMPALFSVLPAIDSVGTLTFTTAPHAHGNSDVTVVSQFSGNATKITNTFNVFVWEVNDAPSFALPPGPVALSVLAGAAAQSVPNFATGFSPGPANESAQALVAYEVTNDNSNWFTNQPAIAVDGTLTYTPAAFNHTESITATVTVRARDNGGTANGGVDTSAPQTFTITIHPAQILVNNATELAAAINAAAASGTTIVLNSNLDLSGLAPITKNVTFTAGNGVALTGVLRVGNGGTVNLGGGNLPGASITVQSGGMLTGNGSFNGTLVVQSGGMVSPGASPGTITADNGDWAGGGIYEWEINHAGGAPGTADLLVFNNALNISATAGNRFNVKVKTLTALNQPGLLPGFDPQNSYTWTLAQAGSVSGFDANALALDTTGFASPLAGGAFALQQSGGSVQLTFTPATAVAPMLAVQRGSGDVTISWPVPPATFNLQSTATINVPGSWTLVTEPPTVTNGTNYLTVPTGTLPVLFYRLRTP